MLKLLNPLNWIKRKTHTIDQSVVNGLVSSQSKESLIDFLLGRGQFKLAAHLINRYYSTCAPLSDSVDMLSEKTATIDPSVWDDTKNEWDNDHPLLTLLKQPNMLETYEDFMERAVALYVLHGEVFFMSTGRINGEPLELFVVSSQSVLVEINQSDGFVDKMRVQDSISQSTFYRHEVEGRFRYYDVLPGQNVNFAMKELIQLKHFNPNGFIIPIHGLSILQSLYFEIEQWLASGKHNLSVLLRGGTPTGIISTDANLGGLTKDQRASLREELDNFLAGAENAGRIAIVDNGLKFNSTSQSNKDMDFRELKKDLKNIIYNRLGIPLPLVNEETMTMANREQSQIQFYMNKIIPLTHRIYSYITLFVMYRYADSENKILKIDTSNIPALEPLKIDKTTKLIDFGILTINETRSLIDFDELANGGDIIYGPASNIPIASNEELPERIEPDNSDDSNEDEDENDDDQKQMTRSEFIKLMQEQKDNDGKRKFTDDRINEIADRENLR